MSSDYVPSVGPDNAKYVVVGDYPTQSDALAKSPFAGEAGQVLRMTLSECGIDPVYDVFYTWAYPYWKRSGTPKAGDNKLSERAQKHWGKPTLFLGDLAIKEAGLLEEQWRGNQLGIVSPRDVLAYPPKMKQFEMGVRKFAAQQPYKYEAPQVLVNELPPLNGFEMADVVAVDLETTGLEWYKPDQRAFMFGMSWGYGALVMTEPFLWSPEFRRWLQDFYKMYYWKVGGHNYKFDALWLKQHFQIPLRFGWDTIAMVNTYHEYWHKDLKSLATYFFDADDYDSEVGDWLKQNVRRVADRTYDKVPAEVMQKYLVKDITYTHALYYRLAALLRQAGRFETPFMGHEMPQVQMLAEVEWNGFAIDTDRLTTTQLEMGKHADLIAAEITDISEGHIQNPGSTKQVGEYLYNTLRLKCYSHTSSGAPSTSESALLEHKNVPIVQAILAWRRVNKLKTSYLDNIWNFQAQGAVHPTYKHWNVVTHRLSAEKPAIQTIPHTDVQKDTIPEFLVSRIKAHHPEVEWDGDYGTAIKRCYSARPGNVLITCDGKGWEMTCAAAQSHDPYLAEKINNEVDVHGSMCDIVWPNGWTKAQRTKEKNIYFGWQYKGSVQAFVMETGLPTATVQKVVDVLNEKLQGVVKWQDEMLELAKTGKIVLPFFNYTIHFDLITPRIINDLPKIAVNYPTQGVGSMIMSRAAYTAQPKLADVGAKIVALVHDDYTIDVPQRNAYRAAQIMQESVANAGAEFYDGIKWLSEFKVGVNWGDLKELTLDEIKELSYG